ncbi:MAG: hypothetical protein ROM54_08855 [Anaerobiospirillum sp.]|nr:hypothetical protein [Anaerobiospirillum sp.]
MEKNPQSHALDEAPDSVAVEPASEAQAQVKQRFFHHDHPLILEPKICNLEPKICNGHLVMPAAWRDDDDDDDYDYDYDK